jgi:hypothetical protein
MAEHIKAHGMMTRAGVYWSHYEEVSADVKEEERGGLFHRRPVS